MPGGDASILFVQHDGHEDLPVEEGFSLCLQGVVGFAQCLTAFRCTDDCDVTEPDGFGQAFQVLALCGLARVVAPGCRSSDTRGLFSLFRGPELLFGILGELQ